MWVRIPPRGFLNKMENHKCEKCGSEEVHILGKFEDGEELMMAIHKEDCPHLKKKDKKLSFMLYRDKDRTVREWPSMKKFKKSGIR